MKFFTLSLTKIVYTVLKYKPKVNSKTRKYLLTFRCDEIVVSIGPGHYHNFVQKVVDKFTKLNKIGTSMESK